MVYQFNSFAAVSKKTIISPLLTHCCLNAGLLQHSSDTNITRAIKDKTAVSLLCRAAVRVRNFEYENFFLIFLQCVLIIF